MQTNKLTLILLLLFAALFLISVITLTVIQMLLLKESGWRVFRERSIMTLYWTDLSGKERTLLWPGIILFFLILFLGTVSKLFG
jgi:hypothetical protein